METTVTASRMAAVLRALLPLLFSVGLLVAGLVVAPGSAAPVASDSPPAEASEPTNHTVNVTLYDAGDATFDDAAEIEAAIEDRRVSDPDEMAVNETLLVVIESERLASEMVERNGSTTDRFVASLDGRADLYLVQTNLSPMVARSFAVVGAENATAYRNGSTVYAMLDTGDLSFRKEGADGMVAHDSFYGDEFAVDFGFDLYEPPWEPPGDPPWGPTFALTDERYLTETPEPTPTDPPTATRTPTAPPLTPGLATTADNPTPDPQTTSTDTPSPAVSVNGSGPQSATINGSGPGFTAVTVLAALLVLSGLRRR